jgi:hypothetical protein
MTAVTADLLAEQLLGAGGVQGIALGGKRLALGRDSCITLGRHIGLLLCL